MIKLSQTLMLGAAALGTATATPLLAQARGPVAIADLQTAISRTNAMTAASNAIKTTYASQISQYDTRAAALSAELQPLITQFQTAQRAPNANQAALQQQAVSIQQRQQAAQAELQRISLPVVRAQAWAAAQVEQRLDAAVRAAMTSSGVAVVLQPQAAISYQPSADITGAITAELNRTVPSVTTTPPANWQPGQPVPGATPAPRASGQGR